MRLQRGVAFYPDRLEDSSGRGERGYMQGQQVKGLDHADCGARRGQGKREGWGRGAGGLQIKGARGESLKAGRNKNSHTA